MTQDRDLIANYIVKHKVTLCAPALASGAETTKITRREIAARRRAHAMWAAEHQTTVMDTITNKHWNAILCEVDNANNWITPDRNLGKLLG